MLKVEFSDTVFTPNSTVQTPSSHPDITRYTSFDELWNRHSASSSTLARTGAAQDTNGMASIFDNGEIRFQYPENWQIDRQDSEEGWTVSVQSPGTAFLLISCYTEQPDVQEVLKTSLQAMQQDYPELESEEASEKIAHHAAKGYDINFFSLDTVNSCSIRSFRTRGATYLVLTQSSSFDSETHVAVLDAIRVTLEISS